MINQEYELQDVESYVNSEDGKIVVQDELTPFQIIQATAKQMNIDIKKPRSGCKHCYGRGYTGWVADTKQPIPCNCIFDAAALKNSENSAMIFNRGNKRHIQKFAKQRMKNIDMKQLVEDVKNAEVLSTNVSEDKVE